jgi:hypothetical protein
LTKISVSVFPRLFWVCRVFCKHPATRACPTRDLGSIPIGMPLGPAHLAAEGSRRRPKATDRGAAAALGFQSCVGHFLLRKKSTAVPLKCRCSAARARVPGTGREPGEKHQRS